MIIHKFQDYLSGDKAFYKQADYAEKTVQDFREWRLKDPVYRHQIDSRIARLAKEIFSIMFFPLGLVRLIHRFSARLILPSAYPSYMNLPTHIAQQLRQQINPHTGEWRYKRLTIEVDGYFIDAAIMGRVKADGSSTFDNKRWVLKSEGNGEFYEGNLVPTNGHFRDLLTELDANAIVFNYAGVGASSGMASKNGMVKAYQAVLRFLEDQEKGIGAKQIIGWGHSIGGGVQGDVLKSHRLQEGIKYVFAKSRTFSSLSAEAAYLFKSRFIGFLVRLYRWNLDSVESSKRLACPEIIIQTAAVNTYTDLHRTPSARVIRDGVIGAECSLAQVLLNDSACPKERKYFLGVPEKHNDSLTRLDFIAQKIKDFL